MTDPLWGFDDSSDTRSKYRVNPLFLQNLDHLGMILVSLMVVGKTYLAWSHSIKTALGVKLKLGFINGKCVCPKERSPVYEQWVRVDCMVTSWI